MIVFDFIYFCIYTLVPDKAILGKRDGSCTLLSTFTAMFLLASIIGCSLVFDFEINVTLLCIAFFGGLFILARVIYLKPKKLRSMHRRFRKIPKWLLKTIGISYILFCFFWAPFLSILTTKMLGK